MRIKHITRAVSLVVMLAVLISVLSLGGMAGTATAETTEQTEPIQAEIIDTEALELPDAEPETDPTEAPSTEPPLEPVETEVNPSSDEEATEPNPEGAEDQELTAPEAPGAMELPSLPELSLSEIEAAAEIPGPDASAELNAALSGSGTMTLTHFLYLDQSFSVSGATISIMHIRTITDNGNTFPAYCLEPRLSSWTGAEYVETANADAWNDLSTEKQRAIVLALAYADGWLGTANRSRTIYDEAAIQALVWDFISGQRNAVTGSFAVATSGTKSDETAICSGVFDHLLRVQNGGDTSTMAPINTAQAEAARTLYHEVLSRMRKHNLRPSFSGATQASAPTYSVPYDAARGQYYLELTDTNNILADFNFTAPGVSLTRSGNKLIIASSSADALRNVACAATGKAYDVNPASAGVTVYAPKIATAGLQAIVCRYATDHPDPIRAHIKLNAATGTATLQKTSPTGDVEGYYFRLHRDSNSGGSYKNWYLKSDLNGNLYEVNSDYSERATRNYQLTGLTDGNYVLVEHLSLKGLGLVRPDRITVSTSGGATPGVSYVIDDDCEWPPMPEPSYYVGEGDLRIIRTYTITGLNGGGHMNITINNAPIDQGVGKISINKVDPQGNPLSDVVFRLDYSVDDGEWSPVSSRDADSGVILGGCSSEELVDGQLSTDAEGAVVFEGLALSTGDNHLRYRLVEVQTLPGYQLLAAPAYEGPITGEEPEIELTVHNAPEFVLPMTGSDGFAGAGIGLGLCLLASVLLLLFPPKKREDMDNG